MIDRTDPGLGLVPVRTIVERGIDAWFPLSPGDRLLASLGDEIQVGTPLAVRLRDQAIREVRAPRAAVGDAIEPADASSPRLAGRRGDGVRAGEYLFDLGGRWRVVTGDPSDPIDSPLDGTVVQALPGAGIRLRSPAQAVLGISALGGPVRGRLGVAMGAGGELRASAIDVGRAGQVLVVGARIDAEALTRARAMGVRGVIVGGLSSKERRDFLASESRQRAARQGVPPFAVLVVEGSIRRPIASPIMAVFTALEGCDVAILPHPPALAFDASVGGVAAPPTDLVRVRGGALLGQEGRWVGLAGARRFEGGVFLEAGLVRLDDGPPVSVPIGDLERFA